MFLKSKPSLNHTFFLAITGTVLFAMSLVGYFWVSHEYERFNEDSITVKAKYIEAQKQVLKTAVENAVELIQYSKSRTEIRLKQNIKDRTQEAHTVAMNIYNENKEKQSKKAISKMIKDALRPIRFNQGRGYFFATNFQGISQLLADTPEFESKNLINIQDSEGKFVTRDMIALVKKEKEGFYKYTWTKPDMAGRGFSKISFVKHFEPFGWFIGTGEYIDDVELDIKKEILERVSQIRFNKNGYIFIGQWDGLTLLGPGKKNNMWDVEDVNGVKIVQELIKTAKAEGGYVKYVLPKFEGLRSALKISYVKGIDDWRWYVGAGKFMDEIDVTIEQQRTELQKSIYRQILKISFILLGALVFIVLITRFISQKIRNNFQEFTEFFKLAVSSSTFIEEKKLDFLEFTSLARSANDMIDLRNQTEIALRESEEKFRLIASQSLMGVILFQDGSYQYINEKTVQIFEYSVDELMSWEKEEWSKLVHPEDVDFVLNQARKKQSGDKDVVSQYSYRGITKSGKLKWIELYSATVNYQGRTANLVTLIDRTERKQAEEALKKSQHRLATHIELTPMGVIEFDNEFKIVSWNPGAERIFGYSAEEALGRSTFDIILPEYEHESVKKIHLQEDPQVSENINHNKTKDGSIITCQWYNTPIYDIQGDVVGMTAVCQDITDKLEIENDLKESEEKYKIAFKTNPDSVTIADLDGLFIEINDGFTQLTGYSAEEVIGKTAADIDLWVIPENRERVVAGVQRDGYVKNLEMIFRRKDGSHLTGLMSASMIELDNEPHFLSITHDISDRKQLEENLQLSEEKYRSITENANEGILIAQDQVHKYANPKICDILGYSEKELLGVDMLDKIHPDDREMLNERHQRRLLGEKFEDSYDLRVITKTGNIKWLRLKPVLITWDEAPATLTFLSDVTEQKNAEIALINYKNRLEETVEERTTDYKRAKDEAEKASRAKSEFLANMSHELRTPLNAVTGFSELLSSLVSDTKQKSYLQSIKTAGRSLLTLINDILDLSKIEAEQVEIQYSPISIKMIFREIEQIFKMRISEKNIELTVNVSDDLPDALFLDETRIRQILLNLVGNAVKFTEKGDIKITAGVSNRHEDSVDLVISVEDTGIGIPKADQKKIFGLFEQQSNQKTSQYGGTGLGLTITQRLLDLMQGQITVNSSPGKGSEFVVRLNNVKIASADIPVPEEYHYDLENIVFEPNKVLAVDDIDSNREFLSELLIKVNLEPLTAVNGQEALRLAEEAKPALIFMDIRMPVMDGIEATRLLKSNPRTKDIPVIALTASSTSEEKARILNLGFDGFLSKPVKLDKLFGELFKHLEQLKTGTESLYDRSLSSRINIDNITDRGLLVDKLKKEILPDFQDQKKAMVMSDIKDFCERLKSSGAAHNIDSLINYAEELIDLVNMFDFESIKKRFQTFPGMIEEIINILEETDE